MDKSEEQLAHEIDMYWHIVAAELEAGIRDESGGIRGEIDWKRRMASYRDWMRRHPESLVVWEKGTLRRSLTAWLKCRAVRPGLVLLENAVGE